MKLRTKNIVIFGGATGIGFSVARALLHVDGVQSVTLVSRNIFALESAKSELNSDKVFIYAFDISNVRGQIDLILDIANIIGTIPDELVISSGVDYDGSNWRGFNISEEDYDRVMDINLKGVFFMIRNFANYLYGNQVKGNICVVSSISAHRDLLSVYQISKNAISGIVHAYGKHLCERGVVINCVEPGTTDGGMLKHLEKYTDGIREGVPWNDNSIRRVIRPEEIAEVILFLMSENSEILSGTCLLAGGGCKTISR